MRSGIFLLPLKTFSPAMPLELIFTKYVPSADPSEVKSPHDQMSLTSVPALCLPLKDLDHLLVIHNAERAKSIATCVALCNPASGNVINHRTLLLQNSYCSIEFLSRGGYLEKDSKVKWVRAWYPRPDGLVLNPSNATHSRCDTGTPFYPCPVLSFPHLQSVEGKRTYLTRQGGCENCKY